MKIEKIAIVTNYNIPDKLAAAMTVAEGLLAYTQEIYIPEIFKERIFRSHNHKSGFIYAQYDHTLYIIHFFERKVKIFPKGTYEIKKHDKGSTKLLKAT